MMDGWKELSRQADVPSIDLCFFSPYDLSVFETG